MSLFLEIELLRDVAISEHSATVGGHRALMYLPGSQLLGAAAAVLYEKLSPDDAWRVFHAGKVRFGNAYVAGAGGAPALPLPLSLHTPKGVSATDNLKQLASHVVNRSRGDDETAGVQLEQVREGFIDDTRKVQSPERRTSLRTAVDRTGRAQDGLLFGITAMQAGTVLRGRIDADDEALLDKIRPVLVGQTLRMGRSKRTELGLVQVKQVEAWSGPPRNPSPKNGRAVLWCLSDLALRNPETGQITLDLRAPVFGLPPDWTLDTSRSFLRTRRYSPFNTHRGRPDLERQVIMAGSVLCFAGSSQPDPAAIERAVARGIGDYRAEGLGQVAYEPALLAQRRMASPAGDAAMPSAAQAPATQAQCPAPTGSLFEWVKEREKQRQARDEAWNVAMEWVGALSKPPWLRLPPAQWGEIRIRARRNARNPTELVAEIRSFTSDGIRKLEKRWGARYGKTTLGQRLVELLEALLHEGKGHLAGDALEMLAVHLSRRHQEGGR